MDFSKALERLKAGSRVTREGWNGKGMWLALQGNGCTPYKHLRNECVHALSKMTSPYIYMRTADGALVPWVASQPDLLADDWLELLNEPIKGEHGPERSDLGDGSVVAPASPATAGGTTFTLHITGPTQPDRSYYGALAEYVARCRRQHGGFDVV